MLPLAQRTNSAPALPRVRGTQLRRDSNGARIREPHKGWHKAHFYNMPSEEGQTDPQDRAQYVQLSRWCARGESLCAEFRLEPQNQLFSFGAPDVPNRAKLTLG